MPLNENDIRESVSQLKEFISALGTTDKAKEELVLVDLEAVPQSKIGSLESILEHLCDSFRHLNRSIKIPTGWEVEIALSDESAEKGYLEVFWSVRRIGAGSVNLPHVIVRRQPDLYEILLPDKRVE